VIVRAAMTHALSDLFAEFCVGFTDDAEDATHNYLCLSQAW